jgi:hypothetical protein
VEPLKVKPFPTASTATQKVDETQDTEVSVFVESMLSVADQFDPLNVTTFPTLSVAAQNSEVPEGTQETASSPALVSIRSLAQVPLL